MGVIVTEEDDDVPSLLRPKPGGRRPVGCKDPVPSEGEMDECDDTLEKPCDGMFGLGATGGAAAAGLILARICWSSNCCAVLVSGVTSAFCARRSRL